MQLHLLFFATYWNISQCIHISVLSTRFFKSSFFFLMLRYTHFIQEHLSISFNPTIKHLKNNSDNTLSCNVIKQNRCPPSLLYSKGICLVQLILLSAYFPQFPQGSAQLNIFITQTLHGLSCFCTKIGIK